MKSKKTLIGLMTSVTFLVFATPLMVNADTDSSTQSNNQVPQIVIENVDNSLVSTVDVLDSSESAVFDPTILPVSGAVQTIKDKNGAVSNISLTPLFNPRTRVSNGSYTINAWGIGWNVTYYINISSNKITSANNLDYIIAMPVNSATVTVDSSKQATARFSFSTPIYNILSWTGWVRATINSSNNIVITTNYLCLH